MYRMYSPCCTAHQSIIVSETLKHSVTLWSGSILGGPGGDGSAQGKGQEFLPLRWRWILPSCCVASLGWVLLFSTTESPAKRKSKKTPPGFVVTFLFLLLGARGIKEQIHWSGVVGGSGCSWHWVWGVSQSSCTFLELSWRPHIGLKKYLVPGQMLKLPEQINPISSCNKRPRRWSQAWVGLGCPAGCRVDGLA